MRARRDVCVGLGPASTDISVTERVKHAIDIAEQLDTDAYDALVVVSGDGLVHEVLNGFARRPDAIRALRLPIGVIPCGSGNALAANVLEPEFASNVAAAALNVLKGAVLPMDLLSVTQGERRYVAFLTAAYGLIADVDVGTDHMRYLGAARFSIAYVQGILAGRTYGCKLEMRVVESDKAQMAAATRQRDQSGTDDPSAVDEKAGMPELRYGTATDLLPNDAGWTTIDEPLVMVYAGSLPYVRRALAVRR